MRSLPNQSNWQREWRNEDALQSCGRPCSRRAPLPQCRPAGCRCAVLTLFSFTLHPALLFILLYYNDAAAQTNLITIAQINVEEKSFIYHPLRRFERGERWGVVRDSQKAGKVFLGSALQHCNQQHDRLESNACCSHRDCSAGAAALQAARWHDMQVQHRPTWFPSTKPSARWPAAGGSGTDDAAEIATEPGIGTCAHQTSCCCQPSWPRGVQASAAIPANCHPSKLPAQQCTDASAGCSTDRNGTHDSPLKVEGLGPALL